MKLTIETSDTDEAIVMAPPSPQALVTQFVNLEDLSLGRII
jgi:hypothetical protein